MRLERSRHLAYRKGGEKDEATPRSDVRCIQGEMVEEESAEQKNVARTVGKLERAHKRGRRFENPVPTELVNLRTMLSLIPLYLRNRAETTPRSALGPFRTDLAIYQRSAASGLRVTWFGHSSSLVEIDGMRLLIDPVWDPRAGPTGWLGPKRFFAPTLDLEELPALDAVLISHDHYDHLGKSTVERLAKARPGLLWITSLGVGTELRRFGVRKDRVTELDWTESTTVRGQDGAELRITALPARHFSGRSPWNHFHTLWSSFVLGGMQHKVYYGADSGLWDGFGAIGEEYGPFDLTMLEVGAFDEHWAALHLGPDGAAQAFRALEGPGRGDASLLMPIHWGLFNLALHGWRQPMERLSELATEGGIRLFSPEPGAPTEVWAGKEVRSGWWEAEVAEVVKSLD